jgi:hypothetical protein
MSDIHIEEFYHDMGLILSRLYASFPRRTTLYVIDISGDDDPDEYGLHSDRYMSCFSAMVWLKDQGYIDFYDVIKQDAVDQVVLTQKSFLLLSNQASVVIGQEPDLASLPPYIAQKSITNIAMLRRALKSQSSIEISKIVSHLMEQSKAF